MIQGRDLIKVILAVGAIIALVVIAMRFADSGGVSSVSGESPKLVISGVNSAGAVPALENYPSAASPTKKSGYTGTLDTKYRSRQPVDCLAGSQLSFDFPDGEPDRLRAYFTYFVRSGDAAMYSEEYEALVYDGSLTLPDKGKDFTVYPKAFYSYESAGNPEFVFSQTVFFRLVASWDDEEYEYAFAVNLEGAAQSSTSVGFKSSHIFNVYKIVLTGTDRDDVDVPINSYYTLVTPEHGETAYIDALNSVVKSSPPAMLPAGSTITVSFPYISYDDISGYYIFPENLQKSSIQVFENNTQSQMEEAVKSLVIFKMEEKPAVIEGNEIILPQLPAEQADGADGTVYYKLLVGLENATFEYIFAVKLSS